MSGRLPRLNRYPVAGHARRNPNYTEMQERKVIISNRLGLHARAAARLVRRAGQFVSSIELVREDTCQCADGKSILAVLLLAASQGTVVVIRAEGEDEGLAADAITELIEQKFGEEMTDGVF